MLFDRSPLISVFLAVIDVIDVVFLAFLSRDVVERIIGVLMPNNRECRCRCLDRVKQNRSVKTMKNNGLRIPSK